MFHSERSKSTKGRPGSVPFLGQILSGRCGRGISPRYYTTLIFPSSQTSYSVNGHLLSAGSIRPFSIVRCSSKSEDLLLCAVFAVVNGRRTDFNFFVYYYCSMVTMMNKHIRQECWLQKISCHSESLISTR